MISFKKYTSGKQLIKLFKKRVCTFCRLDQEKNIDPVDGKLYALALGYRDKNLRNQKKNNLVLVCRICIPKIKQRILIPKRLPYKFFKGTGRL